MDPRKEYGELSYDSGKQAWIIDKVPPHVSIRLKNIFPKLPTHAIAPYALKSTPDICADIQWFMSRYPLGVSDVDLKRLNDGGQDFYDKRAEAEAILLPDWEPTEICQVKPGQSFRKSQLVAADYLKSVGRYLLVDPVGEGKTYSAIAATLLAAEGPSAFVVQPHLPPQFLKKIKTMTSLRCHIVKTKKPYSLPEADIYIFKYSILGGWVNVFEEGYFKHVVFDEIQELRKGTETQKGVASRVLSENAATVLGTSGTPTYGYGIEYFNVYDILAPGCLGNREDFIREWCKNHDKKVDDPDALGTYLREQSLLLRRTKIELKGVDEPPNIIVESVDYDEDIVASSEDLAKQLAIRTLTGTFEQRGQAARELDLRLREATGLAKARNVARFVRMLVQSGRKVVLSGWHRAVYDEWLAEMSDLRVVMYTGSESPAKKEKAKSAMLNDEADVMILSHASGAGLDELQYVCSCVVIGELAWSIAQHYQIIGRVDRDGKVGQVDAYILVSDYGSDPVMMDILDIKHGQQKGVLDPGMRAEKIVRDEGRMVSMARKYLTSLGVESIEACPD